MADRAVSEVVGFVVVFGLIVTTIGLVYASGMPVLTDARDVERVNNAERAFDVFASNTEVVSHRGAPSRATEIKLADAQLRMDERDHIEAIVERSGTVEGEYSISYRPIVYDSGTGTNVVYANGAVIRDRSEGSVMIRNPDLRIGDERSVLHLVETRRDGAVDVGGSGTVLIRTEHVRSSLLGSHTDGEHDVTIRIETARTQAWMNYLESFDPEGGCEVTEHERVSCTFSTDELHVSVTRIDVSVS